MSYLTLVPVDGPRRGVERTVRLDVSTMTDMRLPDGTWVLYDGSMGLGIAVVYWKELPGEQGQVRSVTELHRCEYRGVL